MKEREWESKKSRKKERLTEESEKERMTEESENERKTDNGKWEVNKISKMI